MYNNHIKMTILFFYKLSVGNYSFTERINFNGVLFKSERNNLLRDSLPLLHQFLQKSAWTYYGGAIFSHEHSYGALWKCKGKSFIY